MCLQVPDTSRLYQTLSTSTVGRGIRVADRLEASLDRQATRSSLPPKPESAITLLPQ